MKISEIKVGYPLRVLCKSNKEWATVNNILLINGFTPSVALKETFKDFPVVKIFASKVYINCAFRKDDNREDYVTLTPSKFIKANS